MTGYVNPKRLGIEFKKCNYCGKRKAHIFAGRYGSPRETAAGSFVQRPFYVDAKGKRWYDSKCNACYCKFMKALREKRREGQKNEISSGESQRVER